MDAGFVRAMRLLPCAAFMLLVQAGCSLTSPLASWRPLAMASPSALVEAEVLAHAEANLSAGRVAEANDDPACIDHYFAAARDTWPPAADEAEVAATGFADPRRDDLYRSSLQALVAAAERFGRFDFTQGVQLGDGQWIPVSYYGFLWNPEEFRTLMPADEQASHKLANHHGSPGVGVAYVLVTGPSQRRFVKGFQPLAATVLLAPSHRSSAGGFVLEFYDPHRIRRSNAGLPLAFDLTAPLAFSMSQEGAAWLEAFLQPSESSKDLGLYMLEPYQPGRTPLVLVHGLVSSPIAWSQFINEIQTHSWFMERYQIWTFRYDTGAPFLLSAATFREQLAEIRHAYDPKRADACLSRMVVVGHSMGGIVAKLQVTYSGEDLWRSAVRQPFHTIRTDEQTRTELARAFFFSPSPDVSRVIYVATPHRGSGYARRCIGEIGSSLVERNRDWEGRHSQLLNDNPDAFHDELTRRIPTSIDLLRPDSAILQATNALCYRPGVSVHSIIGDHRRSLVEGRTDGVVPVSSARLAGVQSEIFIKADHSHVPRHAEMVDEVLRILFTHTDTPRATARSGH